MATYGQLIIDFYTRLLTSGPQANAFQCECKCKRNAGAKETVRHTKKTNKKTINTGDQFSKYNINKKCNLSMLCLSIRLSVFPFVCLSVCPIYWLCVVPRQSVSWLSGRLPRLPAWWDGVIPLDTGAQKRAINCTTKSNMQTLTETVETCTCRAICHITRVA